MLKIERAKGGWIVFNPQNFQRHTHTPYLRVARKIRRAVERKEVPQTDSVRLLESCFRLTNDRRYQRELIKRMEELQ